jgi:hypothetical protein
MELKDFVSKSIQSIIQGVVEAQEAAKPHGAHVNPGGLMRTTTHIHNNAIWDNNTNNFAQIIAFDVAVTIEDSQTANAKIGVFSGFAGAKAGAETQDKNTVVSRLSFSVPVLLPISAVDPSARKSRTEGINDHP